MAGLIAGDLLASVLSSAAKVWPWLAGGAAICGVVGAGWLYVSHLQTQNAQLTQAAAVAQDQLVTASGQAAATQGAAAIAAAGAQRAATDTQIHQDNTHAIQAAPGASAPLDPRLNAVGVAGLCKYAAYSGDPRCAGLQQGHPAQLQKAGGGNAAPGR